MYILLVFAAFLCAYSMGENDWYVRWRMCIYVHSSRFECVASRLDKKGEVAQSSKVSMMIDAYLFI